MRLARIFLPVFIFFLFVFSFTAFASELKVINTEKNQNHVELSGAPVFIRPAEGCNFESCERSLLEKNKKISFEASSLRVPYETIKGEFNEDKLKASGISVKSNSEFMWNGSRASLIKVFHKIENQNKTVMGKWILLVDRGDSSWMICCLYNAKDTKAADMALQMIKTVYWDNAVSQELESAPSCSFNTDGTPWRLAGLTHGAFVYTKDGRLPTKAADGALFVVSRKKDIFLLTQKQRMDFAVQKITEIEKDKSTTIISTNDVVIGGLSGIELTAQTNDGKKELVFLTVLFDSKDAHMMVGIAKDNIQENMNLFHAFSKRAVFM